MAARNGGTSEGDLRLNSIVVELTTARPRQALLVDVAIGGTPFSGTLAENHAVQFKLELLCQYPIIVDVRVRRKVCFVKRWLRKDSFAQVAREITTVDGNEVVLQDSKGSVRITLMFTSADGSSQREEPVGPAQEIQTVVRPSTSTRRPGIASDNDQRWDDAVHDAPNASREGDGSARQDEITPDLNGARKILREKPVLLDKLGKFRSITEFFIKAGGAAAELNPIAKACLSAVEKIYQACEAQEMCRDAAIELADRLEIYQRIIQEAPELQKRPLCGRAVDTMLILIKDVSEYVIESLSKKGVDWKGEYNERMTSFGKQFDMAKEQYDAGIATETFQMVRAGLSQLQISMLQPAFEAYYNSEEGCLEGTRIELLAKLMQWIQSIRASGVKQEREIYSDLDLRRIVWLYGLAGSGKSTIANTIAAMLKGRGFTVSCFFCKRDDPSRSSTDNVFPTLCFQLALLFPAYRDAIADLLSGPDVGQVLKGVLSSQVAELFTKPFKTLPEPPLPHVMIIDALDQCADSPDSREKLVSGLITLAKAIPWLKILVTSREQEEIRKGFIQDPDMCHTINIRDVGDVEDDIRFYTKHRLEKLKETRKMKDVSIPDLTERLVTKAENLFVWISTVFRYIEGSANPAARLEDVLSVGKREGPDAPLQQLHDLYDEVLNTSPFKHSSDVDVMRSILGIVNVSSSTKPLPGKAIAAFLQKNRKFASEDDDSVLAHVRGLRAVLYEDGRSGGAVRAYHSSFLDFLSTKMELEGWDSPTLINKFMFDGSLSLMLSGLKFNICGLKDASVLNRSVADLDQRISECIPPELDYSCQHWFTHLRGSGLSVAEAQETVSQFLCSAKALFWLEVLSITGGAERSIPILQQCSAFFEGSEHILQASGNFFRFVSSHSQAMASAPHIYISALSWVPIRSYLGETLRKLFKHHSLVANGLPGYWDQGLWTHQFNGGVIAVAYSPDGSCIAASIGDDIHLLHAISGQAKGDRLKGHSDLVTSISFSPDGSRIASSSEDGTIRIWDTRTGQQVGEPLQVLSEVKKPAQDHSEAEEPPQGHSEAEEPVPVGVRSVAFSPDGIRIASGSDDAMVRIWDSSTGEVIGERLRGHLRGVTSVAFSHDGIRIASGSADRTVRLWDIRTGKPVGKPLEGHTDWVRSIAFAPDGMRVVSGSDDATIRIWDPLTGEGVGEPLRGHSDWVLSVAFSLDGARIISGSRDNTIRMWSSRTGEALGAPLIGHSAPVNSVACSPDGAHALSGSDDGTVRVWSLGASNVASEPQRGHTDGMTSVAFSSDGGRIVSGSGDQTIRIWDTRTGRQAGEPLRGHSKSVLSVAFSPDGAYIASGSDDKTVRKWDSRTGVAIGEPLQGHTDSVTSVAFSPNGSCIVSGSQDKTVRIWDSRTGELVGEPLEGHTDWVRSIAFAPDGIRVVSGSDDATIRIWNLRTGKCVGEPLRGHSNSVLSVAFSPDGTRIASGSADGIVRIWDAGTGESIGNTLKGHTDNLSSLAFSLDGSRIVSGSWDSTIGIWDLKTGEAVGEPLRCHSNGNWVRSVAFSPDGRQVVSGSDDKNIFVATLADPERDDWNRICRSMDVTNGWVKDDDGKLLLWIPERYRHYFKHNVAVWIRDGRLDNVPPAVDLNVLKEYSGTEWTRIYKEGDEEL